MAIKRSILITGSSGMLGVDLCHELRRGYEVVGVDRIQSTEYRVQGFVKSDITDKKKITSIIGRFKPDVVVHAAAWTDVDGCELDPEKAYMVNREGTKNVALACKAAGSTLVYISTDYVFDGKKRTAYKETDKTGPISVYGDSKLKGEEAIRKILRKYFILRTSWLYGHHGKNFIDTILAKARAADTLKVVRDQVGSPTYTVDLAKAICALLARIRIQDTGNREQAYGIYHVSNAGSVSWCNYAREILKLTGSKAKVIPISSRELARPAKRPAMSVLDNSKFIKFTGYRMRNYKEALKEYLC